MSSLTETTMIGLLCYFIHIKADIIVDVIIKTTNNDDFSLNVNPNLLVNELKLLVKVIL